MVTGKEKTAGRIGNTAKGSDAACRHKRPALRVARGGSPGASKPSIVVSATLFELLLPDHLRPGAMTIHEGVRSPG